MALNTKLLVQYFAFVIQNINTRIFDSSIKETICVKKNYE